MWLENPVKSRATRVTSLFITAGLDGVICEKQDTVLAVCDDMKVSERLTADFSIVLVTVGYRWLPARRSERLTADSSFPRGARLYLLGWAGRHCSSGD